MKVGEKKMTRAEELEATQAIAGAGVGYNVIPVLNKLLNQNAHYPPPSLTSWSCCCSADHLLGLMREQNGGNEGLSSTGDDLISWLKVPANARKVREAQILISFPPHPRTGERNLVRLERAETPTEYRDRNS